MKFPEYGSEYSFPEFEVKVQSYWTKQKVFERSLKSKSTTQRFFFYDGPPFATGLPHYGHILAGTIKDIVPRYWSMRGYSIPRRFGWDTHGLPVEFEMEKTLGLNGSLDILDYGVAKFNEACRGTVLKHVNEWRQTVDRMGRWVDMDNDYKTMDPDFMESVWWVFKELWKKGLIYEGKKVVPYSWRLTAPLSNFEASLNYKDVQDPAITVLLPITTGPSEWIQSTALAVWTTTPWTLPSNLAVAAHSSDEQVSYGRYRLPSSVGAISHIILAKSRAEAYGLEKNLDSSVSFAQLTLLRYQPLFKCYQDQTREKEGAFRVVDGSKFVSSTDGTGLVHMAPSFGEDDFYTCQEAGISPVDPTDANANFTAEILVDPRLKECLGVFVKDADKLIIKALKESHSLLKQDVLQHAYPFCERSDTPLIYKAISSWFVKVTDLKDQMMANNQKIRWVPEHIKDGRFGKWLENSRDWCISRNRFWGNPIPVWRCHACGHLEVMGSRAELEKAAKVKIQDLHKHFVDELHLDCPQCSAKSSMDRTPEVLDCWFESGSMPYAQSHYPFENKEAFEKSFPADFIGEGLDQTRGWFYTLTVISTALFNQPAFKNCIVNGMVLAEDGRKMSKRLKNYPAPGEIFNQYGADALRLYLLQSPAMHGEELRFSEKNLLELMRAVMIPFWNAYSFFASYANIDEWSTERTNKALPIEKRPLLDQWILARAQETEKAMHASMESYQLASLAPLLIEFIDDLTNWYIRLNRERFWADKNEAKEDKDNAYSTLLSALMSLAKVMAPGLPFVSEVLMAALRGVKVDELISSDLCSVHEMEFDASIELNPHQIKILSEVSIAKKMILLGRSLRGEAKIGLRQPLPKLRIAGLSEKQVKEVADIRALVLSEVNVKEVEIVSRASDLVEESVKPNHKILGKKVGGAIKNIQSNLATWTPEDILNFEKNGFAEVCGHRLITEDITVVRKAKEGRLALAAHGLVAELDTHISTNLHREGLVREIIHKIQQARKELQLHLADRIEIHFHAENSSLATELLEQEISIVGEICSETLSVGVKRSSIPLKFEADFGKDGQLSFHVVKA